MKRMLVVLDHYDADMFKVVNKKAEGNFLHSVVGSILSNKIIGHPKTGLDTKDTTVDLKFLYTDKVPPRNKYTNAVVKPSASILHKKRDEMVQYILDTKPDIVVSYGSWFKNELTSLYKLPKDMFELIPFKLPQSDFTTYLVFNPSLKQQFFLGSYERDKMIISNRMVNRFLKGGIENTKPQFGKYRLVTNYHEVERIFNEVLPKYPIIALDFETNTLETYRKGAKAIMVSMSWEEHQGVSIPLNHRLSPNLWTKEQFDSIINMIKELMMKEQRKVLHNCIYDIHMMMDIYGLEYATNCVDTMLMYYETVDENQGAQRGLKHLAYKYTDMGGYEDERDQAIEQYLKNDYDRWYSTEMEKYEKGERSRKPSKTQYTAPTNQVDGGKVDFEWLPMETIYKYASADTDVTLQLYHIFDKKVKSRPKWIKFCYEFFPQLCDTLAYMQHTGFQMDMDKMEKYREHFTTDIEEVTKKMYEVSPEIQEYENHNLALLQEREQIKAIKPADRTPEQKEKFKEYGKLRGEDTNGIPKYKFNPGSSEKIGYVLYHMLGYKLPADKEYLKPKAVQSRKLSHPEKLTWKDYKTDRNSALPYIKKTYHAPLVDLLLTYSNDKKMISSTIEGYSKLADTTGKLHTTFHPAGCLDGDTLVPTSLGIKKLKDLSENRVEDTFKDLKIGIINKDNNKELTDAFYYSGIRDSYQIKLENGNSIITTPNHPLVVNNFLKTNNKIPMYKYKGKPYLTNYLSKFNDEEWLPTKDIKAGYWIKGTIGGNIYGNKTTIEFDDSEFPSNTRSNKKIVTLPHKLTPELAEFLGMYTADGSYSSNKKGSHIFITNDDRTVQNRLGYLIKHLFNIDPYYRVDTRYGKEITVTINSTQVFRYLKKMFNISSRGYEKTVPQLILDSTREVQLAYLKGLTLDSSICKKKYPSIYLSTTSEEQAKAVYSMLLNIGIYARFAKRKVYPRLDHKNEHPLYDVMISHEDVKIFIKYIGFVEVEEKLNPLLDKVNNYSYTKKPSHYGVIRYKNFLWIKVKSIDYLGKRPMYDLKTSNTHSFLSNNIISHNTATSRLASSGPNLQNVKKPTSNVNDPNYNYSAKGLFKSRFKGGYIFNIDYKSLEIFISSLVSKDIGMMQALMDGADIHKRNASLAFNIPVDEVDSEHRYLAKAVSFGYLLKVSHF